MDELIEKLKYSLISDSENKADELKTAAALFVECIDRGGVVQMIGANEYEEFISELYYRSGGLAPFHKMTTTDLVLHGLSDDEDVYDKEEYLKPLLSLYQIEKEDMFLIVSEKGEEAMLVSLAKQAKAQGRKVVAILVEESETGFGPYADALIHIHRMNEAALYINDCPTAQINATINDILAQMLSFETYGMMAEKEMEIDIFLSNNNPNAGENNSRVLEKYKGRIHA